MQSPFRALSSLIAGIRHAVVPMVLLTGMGTVCWADAGCPAPRPGFPSVEDQDADGDPTKDVCITTNPIRVPKVPDDFDKPGSNDKAQGWGFLVLTFNVPIDGGAFLFGPNCLDDTLTQGTLNDVTIDAGKTVTDQDAPPNTMIKLGPGGYGIGATDSPSVPNNPNSPPFLTFNVTILYDKDGGVPQLVSAYWKAKAPDGGGDFTYRPENYAVADRDWYDVTADVTMTPEPAMLPLLGAGCALLFAFSRRRMTPFQK